MTTRITFPANIELSAGKTMCTTKIWIPERGTVFPVVSLQEVEAHLGEKDGG
jgi:hypothetical protein